MWYTPAALFPKKRAQERENLRPKTLDKNKNRSILTDIKRSSLNQCRVRPCTPTRPQEGLV